MCVIEHFITTSASEEKIWEIWSHVKDWHLWDHDIKDSWLENSFQVGTKGFVVLKNDKKIPFTITKCEKNRLLETQTKFLLCTLTCTHKLDEMNGSTKIINRVEFSGLLSFFFNYIIGKKMDKNIPITLESLVKWAEGH